MRNRTELVTNQLGSDYDEEGSDFEADSGEDWKPEEKEVNCNYLRPTKSFNIDFYFLSFDIFQQPAKKGAKKSPAKRKAPTPRGSAKKGAKKPKKEESESEEEPDSEEDVDDEELIEEYIEDDGEDGAVSIPTNFPTKYVLELCAMHCMALLGFGLHPFPKNFTPSAYRLSNCLNF